MKKLVYIICLLIVAGCTSYSGRKLTGYVNPFIGTAGHGHTYPGATVPFGMVQLSADTRKDNWDACSGYHYSDSLILGFSHTHLSGTGVGDYGDVRFTPMTGQVKIRPADPEKKVPGYGSKFSHSNEKASPGYYKVRLDDYRITAELTATARCGFHKYNFTVGDSLTILIDLKEAAVSENNLDLYIEVVNDHEICGYRKSSGWADKQAVYFDAEFSRPFTSFGIYNDGQFIKGTTKSLGADIQAFVQFDPGQEGTILAKVGISGVSIEGARRNLQAEIPGWDFEVIKKDADRTWENELNKVVVTSDNEPDKIKFYTALYHSYLVPNIFTDVDGQYRGNDGNIHIAEGFQVYTVFSLWDTYRALHPLLSFLQPERTADFINTFIDIYEKRGLLPVWELAGNETWCMIGYHAVPVIVDCYLKGIKGFDAEKAYQAARNSAIQDHFGLKYYKEYGYIPADKEGESISKTLEYAYDDWCIAMMAKALGKEDDYKYFLERAQYYKNLFDPGTGFIRGKRNGMFTEPFDPTEVNFMLTEANTWQYTFYVPQDISGLSMLMGGDQAFESKLDTMFNASTKLSGRDQSDITGQIGQYAHGNEPSHHMAYLYDYVGKPFKTQWLVRKIMGELYGEGADGLCGNEDCGQMSAWFVLSAMGFYEVTPGSGIYAIGSPLFEKAVIHLGESREFIIKADGNSAGNIYIQSATLNGQPYNKLYIRHEDLVKGGELVFHMGSSPSEQWAAGKDGSPVSAIMEDLIVPVPYFKALSATFQDSVIFSIQDVDPDAEIYFTSSKTNPDQNSNRYQYPVKLTEPIEFNAIAILDNGNRSKVASSSFYKIHNDWKVRITNPYSPQYSAGGDMALIDGQRGGPNFRTGSWQGYQGTDFEAVIDLGKSIPISEVRASFLQDQRSWIFMPVTVGIGISDNPNQFNTVAVVRNDVPENAEDAIIKVFSATGLKAYGRYVCVTGKNRGVCPPWHPGAGDKSWIFIDEITIN